MLKNFKLNKRDSGSKSRITSADISSPTQSQDSPIKHITTVPIRYLSNSTYSSSPRKSFNVRNSSKDVLSAEKVVKAHHSYKAHRGIELSFSEGDFFFVVNEDKEWYHVTNPSTNQNGIVPKQYFEAINKTSRIVCNPVSVNSNTGNLGSLYAIVLYDFKAEKSDELSSFVGENLFICAHHNYEWFIAKPIGRLGGPGLVPVGFVSIIDISTGYATGNDVMDDIKSVNLPTVQEWKNHVAKYKASNIALGSVEEQNNRLSFDSNDKLISSRSASRRNSEIPPLSNFEQIIDGSIDSFGLENDKYYFDVRCILAKNKLRKLRRYYQDFYDLQVKLLDTFPSESGKLRDKNGQWTKRIIPYIPGPVPYVTDTITQKRKEDLNIYIKDLIKLPEYISHSSMVNSLFELRDNGYDNEVFIEKTMDNAKANILQEGAAKRISSRQHDSTLTGDDLGLYKKMSQLSLSSSRPQSRPPSVLPPQPVVKTNKIKFYYKDDIFALKLHGNITLNELRSKISPRVDTENFMLKVKLSDGDGEEIKSDEQVIDVIEAKLKISVYDL
ncbi:hypothetical protein KAFR_0E03160 [Kazachstania africana CBS 2517]|uniref:Bud emergence protein 1 n=1 Tax=Kazachstania africana (strain ATCC 22294 / BCRC 22015 / CBS 2517 / CECT 1963 / NBRC 1671 / NRRL Y-8276) TaxID=1071382 RepID=H2AVR8_KAZAF|nr:hypothetical protein KAFR_0E03160 [Kazachstania africana CBS 2517]CCF58468.1 hypothetical protein KAFR_0E03160 [Kazachstania africana CBS 2517]